MINNCSKLKPTFRVALVLYMLVALSLSLVVSATTVTQAAVNPTQLLVNGGIVNPDGTQVVTLPSVSFEQYQLPNYQWSPDGSKIAYSSPNDGLGVVNVDGSGQRKLGSGSGSFSWSPDSTRLAFVTGAYENSGNTILINADGSNAKQINGLRGSIVGWKPDGSQVIIYESNLNSELGGKFNLINADGTGLRTSFSTTGYVDKAMIWYDGQRLLYYKTDYHEMATQYKSYLVNFDGTGTVEIPNSSSIFSTLRSSGTKVFAFYDNFGSGDKAVVMGIADPIGTQRILPITERILDAAWIPGSDDIVAAIIVNKNQVRLERINTNTSAITPLFVVPNLDYTVPTYAEAPGSFISGMTIDATTGLLAFNYIGLGDTTSAPYKKFAYIVNLSTQKTVKLDNKIMFGWRPSGSSNSPTTYGNILPDFYNVWKQSDLAIATGQSNKSWLWGPDATATKTEDYKEAKGGKRQVQYFDKARMEINNPDGDKSSAYFVTNGLLPKELIGGYIQTGDSTKQSKAPAEVNVAGDPNGSITYAKLAGVVTLEPGKNTATDRTGQKVTVSLDRTGKVSDGTALAGVTLAQFLPETGHNLPNVFVDYFKTLPQDWLFVMGYPISEPYQTEITLAGKPTQVLIQVFERRVLTYTPSNADPFKVEQGNVGLHYYQWRYGN
ncbi:MAG: hypothetical protein WCS37_14140 [Chloroflexota bacterium]